MNPNLTPRRCIAAVLAVALLAGTAAATAAAEAGAPPVPKAEGTWKWTFTMPDGTKVNPRAKLQRDGNVLTGRSLIGPGTEVAISDGRVDGDEVTWSVVREHSGRKVTTRYSGKLSGELLRGTIESDWTGDKEVYLWEAKRASDSPTGIWRWELNFGGRGGGRGGAGGGTPNAAPTQGAGPGGRGGGGGGGGRGGFRVEMSLKLDAGKLTGKVKGRPGDADTEITNTSFADGKIAFEVERRRSNGDITVTKYWGTLDGDTIKGKSEFEVFEEVRTVDWEATRVEE